MSNDKSAISADDFDQWAQHIAAQIRRARAKERKGRATLLRETEWGAAAYNFFQYIDVLERKKLFVELEKHLGRARGARPSRSGLVMRLVERTNGQGHLLSPTRRSRLSAQLEIARKMQVDPDLILGFLCEIGGQRDVKSVRYDDTKRKALRGYRKRHRRPKTNP